MSIPLVNLSFKQFDLTPSEKHILTILCFRADPDTYRCWPSFTSLMNDSGYSRDTINRLLSALKEKKKIIDTGDRKGKTKSIIVYSILIHKQSDGNTAYPVDNRPKQSDGAWKQYDGRTAKQSDGADKKDHNKEDLKDHKKRGGEKCEGVKAMRDILEKLKS